MRFEGTLTSWNEDRGFGYLESTQGGEPIFVHISAWPRGTGKPHVSQVVSFEISVGPKGKRARNVRSLRVGHARRQSPGLQRAKWDTATLLAIPAFLVVYGIAAVFWRPAAWVPFTYLLASAATFAVYAGDKAAATRGTRRTPESTLHLLALACGWPGALLAQQLLRHKSTKQAFRLVFWSTVLLNVGGLLLAISPVGHRLVLAP